jgi:hypothetical protein
MNNGVETQLIDLFKRSNDAHNLAIKSGNSADPEWPIWYADHVYYELKSILGANFTKSELIYLLVLADREQRLQAPGANRPVYYSRFFIQRYMK